jgi:hypothetical protein
MEQDKRDRRLELLSKPLMDLRPRERSEVTRKKLRERRQYAWTHNSLLRVIRVMCQHCRGGEEGMVVKCRRVRCPVWPWRLVKGTADGFRIARDMVELEQRQDRIVAARLRAEQDIAYEVRGIEALEFPWWRGPQEGLSVDEEMEGLLQEQYGAGTAEVERLMEEARAVAEGLQAEAAEVGAMRKEVWGSHPGMQTRSGQGEGRGPRAVEKKLKVD